MNSVTSIFHGTLARMLFAPVDVDGRDETRERALFTQVSGQARGQVTRLPDVNVCRG